MTKYLISFPSGATIVPAADFQAVSDASHSVVREAKDAGCVGYAVHVTGIDDAH